MGLGPGYLISKHVKLVRMLGRGGMGSVWIADHLALKTQVAVKFMSSALATDPNMLTRFEREATSAAQIKSPHVVHILDHGVTGDAMPYIVMELLEGEDLSMRLKRTGPLPPEDVATIVLQTCKALGKAHKLGIVHRDIKPSNIFLLDTDGDIFVKVLDFGIAKPGGKETSDVTSTGAIVGTVVYMSPEQLLNAKHVDYRADLWSVAVVAYRAMTGHLPFSDEDGIGSLCLAFEQGSFVPASEINPRLTPAIDAWFKRAFKRDPAARFPSMKEMVSELFAAVGVASPMSLVSAGGAGSSDARGSFDPPSLRLSATGATSGLEEEAKPTVLEPSQPSSRSAPSSASLSGIEGSAFSNPSRTLSSPKDPATLGTAAALTVPGEGPTPASSGRSKVLFGIVAVLGLLLGGGFLATFLTHRGQVESWMGVSRDESTPRPATEAPGPVGTGPSVTPLATAADPAPRPTPSNTPDGTPGSTPGSAPTAAPSAEPSAAPTVQAGTSGQPAPSSAPSGAPAAGPKPQVRPGTTSRPASPEKDYGF